MRIPKQLKISGYTWTIEENERVSDAGDCYGLTETNKQRITISPNQTRQAKEQTLFHEMMHAVWHHAGLEERYRKQEDLEEEIIAPIAHGMYQALKDNGFFRR